MEGLGRQVFLAGRAAGGKAEPLVVQRETSPRHCPAYCLRPCVCDLFYVRFRAQAVGGQAWTREKSQSGLPAFRGSESSSSDTEAGAPHRMPAALPPGSSPWHTRLSRPTR